MMGSEPMMAAEAFASMDMAEIFPRIFLRSRMTLDRLDRTSERLPPAFCWMLMTMPKKLASGTGTRILGPLNYRNLDEVRDFAGRQTTTEFLSRHIFDQMADACRRGDLGPGSDGITRMRVMLHESHVARAWFEGALGER